jgi:hypothetical protein
MCLTRNGGRVALSLSSRDLFLPPAYHSATRRQGCEVCERGQRLFLWLTTWKCIRLVVVRSLTPLSLSHRSVTRRQDRSADTICEGGGICPLLVAVRVKWPDGGSTTNASWFACRLRTLRSCMSSGRQSLLRTVTRAFGAPQLYTVVRCVTHPGAGQLCFITGASQLNWSCLRLDKIPSRVAWQG